jgi:hypothetical protein
MSPVTHFFTGWVLANSVSLDRRERVLVTLACVAPDIDGLGIVADYFTRDSPHPLEWFSTYHHSLHSLPFAIVVAAMSFVLAVQRWKTAGMAFLSFHIHLLEDLLSHAVLSCLPSDVARTVGSECVAQFCHYECAATGDVLSRVPGIFSVGDGLAQG